MKRFTNFLRFSGRDRRRTYWIVSILASLVLIVLMGVIVQESLANNLAVLTAAGLLMLPCMLLMIATSVRRLHDRNRSGWWMLLYGLMPVLFGPDADGSDPLFPMLPDAVNAALMLLSMGVSLWALVDLGILRGSAGPNRYGANPKEEGLAEVFS